MVVASATAQLWLFGVNAVLPTVCPSVVLASAFDSLKIA